MKMSHLNPFKAIEHCARFPESALLEVAALLVTTNMKSTSDYLFNLNKVQLGSFIASMCIGFHQGYQEGIKDALAGKNWHEELINGKS